MKQLFKVFRASSFLAFALTPKRAFAAVKLDQNELKQRLDRLTYHVTQEKGTERPGTGEYYHHKEVGDYLCVCCGEKLFSSETKYDSGSGWPAFFDYEKGKVATDTDNSFGMKRVEVHCANCNSHLGHVFEDGPKPTGLRYCVNSVSLEFKRKEDK